MTYRLPGPDFGGLKSFDFQLVSDETGTPMLLSDEVIALYLAYRAKCHLERAEARNFEGWLNSTDEAGLPAAREATEGLPEEPAMDLSVEATDEAALLGT